MNRLAKHFITTTSLVILAALLSMLVRTLYAHALSPSMYGLLFSLQALVLFLTPFLNLGTGEALNYFLPREKAWKAYLTAALLITLVTSSLGMLVFLFFAPSIALLYLKDASLAWSIRAFSLGVLAWPLLMLLRNAYRARGRPEAYPLADVLIAASRIPLARFSQHVLFTLWNTLPLILTLVYAFPLARFFTKPSRNVLARLVQYSIPLMLSSVIILLLTQIDVIMLTLLASLQSVGVYAANLPYLTFTLFILQPVIILAYPRLSPLSSQDFTREAKRAFTLLLTLTLLLTILALPILPVVLRFLLPAAYQPTPLLLSILLIGSLLASLSRFVLILPSARGRVGERFVWSLGMILINILANLLLIPRFAATGAALGTLLASLPPLLLTSSYRLFPPLHGILVLLLILSSVPLFLLSPWLAMLPLALALLLITPEALRLVRTSLSA